MKGLAVVLLVIVGLSVLLDRVAAGVVEGQVAQQLAAQGELAGRPDVDVRGFPFLTQAVAGRYDDVRISVSAEELGRSGVEADVVLRGVRVPLSAALAGEVREVPVDRVDGTARLSYDLLAAELGGDTTLEPEGNGLRITRTVEILGSSLPLTAAGTVSVDGADLIVDVERAAGAGVDVPGFLVDRAADLLDLRYRVDLPYGLRLTDVTPAAGGVDVRVEGRDTVFSAE